VQPLYFLCWFLMLYLFLTIAEIPYLAWQSEITRDYQTRSKVSGFRTAFYSAGGLLFAASPMLPMFDTHEMTPAVMKFLALVLAVSLPAFCLIAAAFAPRGKPVAVKTEGTIWIVLRDLIRNKPFMIFTASYLLTGLGAGMQVGLVFLYFDTFLGIGNRFPEIMFVMSAVPMLSIPVWLRLINKFGKHRAFAGGRVLSGVFTLGLITLEPGPSVFPAFMAIWICMMSMYSAIMIISPAIVGDIVDYDLLKSGRNRAGQYNAVYLLVTKVSFGIGAGFAFYLVDIFGYDTAATIHDRTSTIGMWTAMIILPAVCYFISSVIMWFFPIDERRHTIIRRRIEMRTQRAKKNMEMQ
ncbi:MAG: MFS transporter, partial [Deltaproteobacteria bacterium]|nr:MFS transporter [Deltaproteobacteria bacterium]